MAHGFDELVDFLLDEVALCLAAGASLDDFKSAVARFYAVDDAETNANTANIDHNLLSNVNNSLLQKVWTWLLVHPDIWVGKSPSKDDTIPEILVSNDQNASILSFQEAEALELSGDSRIRVWASHERVWQTVAGHGVDFKRVPGEEFRLLCMIAAAGVKGIAQPELVKQSKQDKKSVPGRTDNLHKAGYIRKTRILAEKHNTSLLIHRRFIPKEELDVLDRPVFINGSLSFDNLLTVLREKLKNGAAMTMDDLEEELGCSVKSWQKRALWRALERLDIIGVVQRYRQEEQKLNKRGLMRVFKTKTLRLLREPTEEDYRRYTSLTVKERNDFRKRLEAQDAETKGEHAEHMDDDDYGPLNSIATLDGTAEQALLDVEKNTEWKMQWDSDAAWTNTVFNAVDRAGAPGLSSMAVRTATYGQFYDRPVEQMLARLTDVWQNAQPDHLAHFSIIRDTDTKGRSTNYVYRIHEAFQKAVDDGDTLWENATNGAEYEHPQPKFDQFGFSVLNSSHFLKDGGGSLSEAVTLSKFTAERLQKNDPTVGHDTAGSLVVVWINNQAPKRQKRGQPTRDGAGDGNEDLPTTPDIKIVKKKGRPRKDAGTSNSTQPLVLEGSQTEQTWRMKAEKMAYEEAQKQQKENPPSTVPGMQIGSTWSSGRGRPRMLLVNDSIPVDEAASLEQLSNTKRLPIVVLESRVQAIMKLLRTTNDTATPQSGLSIQKQKIVMLRSPRLSEYQWFNEPELSLPAPIPPAEHSSDVVMANTALNVTPAQEKRAESTRTPTPTLRTGTDVGDQEDITDIPETSDTVTQKPDSDGPTQVRSTVPESGVEVQEGYQLTSVMVTPRKDWAQRQSNYIRPPAPNASERQKKRGTVVGRGTAQYKRILLVKQIMEKSGGIFPGDSEMVPAFQKLQKLELKSETTSDRDTVMKAVKTLVDDGKLTRFAFFFKDKHGKEVQKWIIHEPHIAVDSQEIKDLMQKIEDAHPRNYIPPPYGDGETGRGEQRKNIDRFQYRPGKSIIQPSGTEFIIDIEAKRKELENRRLAAAAAIRAEEMRRIKAQAARNKHRNAAIARKGRRPRNLLMRTKQIDSGQIGHMEEYSADTIIPSVESDGTPVGQLYTGRSRYRDIRPAPPVSELQIAKLDSGLSLAAQKLIQAPMNPQSQASRHDHGRSPRPPIPSPHLTLPGGQILASSNTRRKSKDQLRFRASKYNRTGVTEKPKRSAISFRLQGPKSYDRFYEVQDISTLLQPTQRFHPNTGTYSTDFFVRTNVRFSHWLQPSTFTFKNHSSTNPEDIQMYDRIDDQNNHYHPEKHARKIGLGQLSKKTMQTTDTAYDSDLEFEDQDFELKQLRIMREEFPDLIHEPRQDEFVSYTFGGEQETAEELYGHGVRPMERIVLHGADPDDFQGVQFEEMRHPPIITDDYADVSTDDEDDEEEIEPLTRRYTARAPKRTRSGRKGVSDLADHHANNNVLPAPPRFIKETRTGVQSGDCQISIADSRRLFFACIAVRVLNSTIESNINWTIIQGIFVNHPNFDLPTFKARWNRMWNTHNDVVRRMEHEFQDAYVIAYVQDIVPRLDITHGNQLTYKDISEWVKVVEWAVRAIPVFPDEFGLPVTRHALGMGFRFQSGPNDQQDDREKLEHIHTTNARRDELTHSATFYSLLPVRKRSSINDVTLVKSWIRANCAVSDKNYEPGPANAKIQTLDQSLVLAATKEMHTERLIAHHFKSRDKVARNYYLSDQYNHIFNKRPLDAASFAEAVAFKLELEKIFASEHPRLLLQYNIHDGVAMAITEMLAAGRISVKPLLPPVDSTIGAPWPRLTVWGFTEGQYKLRNMDRKIFTWAMEVVPTSTYIYGLEARSRSEMIEPPRHPKQDKAGRERIPLWYDIQGNFLPRFWEGLLRSVIQHMAIKAGSSITTLAAPYRGLVWEWEIDLLVDWLIDVGVAVRDQHGAVNVAEWWWTIIPTPPAMSEAGADSATLIGANEVMEEPTLPVPKKRRVRKEKV